MTKRSLSAQLPLWLFVIFAGIVAGGSIFEGLVLTPLWAGAPPASVTSWEYGAFQGRFFARFTPLYGLFSLSLLIASWFMPRPQKWWALAAGLSGVLTLLWTITFFMPLAGRLQVERGAGLSGEEIVRMVDQWRTWQWGRWFLLLGGWIAGLRALSLSRAAEPHETQRAIPDPGAT